jgi:uncharacterized protein
VKLTLAGEIVHLLAARALYWPRERSLIVADLHVGKADVFRARGIPIPAGSSAQTLACLSQALARAEEVSSVPAAQIIVLGDFFHAKESLNENTLESLQTWRITHKDIEITIVEGNHDQHAGTKLLTQISDIRVVDEPFNIAPFAFAHHPPEITENGGYTLYGHIHPCTLLRSSVDRMRVPCFVFGAQSGVLPAFGAFTGGHVVTPERDQTVYAIADTKILKIPAAQNR